MTDAIEMPSTDDLDRAHQIQKQADAAEKMAAYRMHSRGLAGGVAGAIGYASTPYGIATRSTEAENRRTALQIGWDLYRDSHDHKLVLRAAREISEFLDDQKDKLS